MRADVGTRHPRRRAPLPPLLDLIPGLATPPPDGGDGRRCSRGRSALALLVGIAVALTTPSTVLAARLFDPAVLGGLMALQAVVLGWRLIAVLAVGRVAALTTTPTTVVAVMLAFA